MGCRDSSSGNRLIDGGPDDTGPVDHATFEVNCPADAMGGGLCPINFCGLLKSVAALGLTETGQSGADALCSDGRSCVATMVVPAGNAFQLTCVPPQAGAVAFGAACTTGAGSSAPCKDDSLCVSAPDFPDAPFCSAMCRVDADCPADSYCLEYQRPLPSSYALVGMCTPAKKIAPTICKREADCPTGQGCVRYGMRTDLLVCKAGGALSLGAPCTDGTQCRSGECYDRDFRLYVAGGGSRTYCSGICSKNSDCGADQRCVREVIGNNGTPAEPRDDIIVGYCRTLFVSPASAACATDQDCVAAGKGGDSCDVTHGLCYSKNAVIGGACVSDDGCGLGAACETGPTFANGACLLEGCSPTATGSGVDACPGPGAVCSQRASDQPLFRCYEGCVKQDDCTRGAESYFCAAAQPGQPVSICLSR
jgi:hypothetical protein